MGFEAGRSPTTEALSPYLAAEKDLPLFLLGLLIPITFFSILSLLLLLNLIFNMTLLRLILSIPLLIINIIINIIMASIIYYL